MLRTMAAALAGLAVTLSGCAMGSPSVVRVGLITDVTSPGTFNELPIGSKRGEACANTLLGIMISGDASLATAAANGGISKISISDYKHSGFYPFVGETCTIVHGQ